MRNLEIKIFRLTLMVGLVLGFASVSYAIPTTYTPTWSGTMYQGISNLQTDTIYHVTISPSNFWQRIGGQNSSFDDAILRIYVSTSKEPQSIWAYFGTTDISPQQSSVGWYENDGWTRSYWWNQWSTSISLNSIPDSVWKQAQTYNFVPMTLFYDCYGSIDLNCANLKITYTKNWKPCSPVPEPSTIFLLFIGLAGLVIMRYFMKKTS